MEDGKQVLACVGPLDGRRPSPDAISYVWQLSPLASPAARLLAVEAGRTQPQGPLLGLAVVASGFSGGPAFGCASGTLGRRHRHVQVVRTTEAATVPPHYLFQRRIRHPLSSDVKPLKLSLWSTAEDGTPVLPLLLQPELCCPTI